jgi:transcriptional regulator with XRE-family HTH domain
MTSSLKTQELKLTISQRIRENRKAAGLTQEELSDKIDIAPQYLSRLETGHRSPSLNIIVALAEVLNTTPSALLAEPQQGTDTQVERIDRIIAMFRMLPEEDAAFLESELINWMSHLNNIQDEDKGNY